MKQIVFFFLVAITVLSLSCKKETPYVRSSEVVFGETDNMIINTSNKTIFGAYYEPSSVIFDIDNDGHNDISIISNIHGSPGLGMLPELYIKFLSNDFGIYEETKSFGEYYNHQLRKNFSNNTYSVYIDDNYYYSPNEETDSLIGTKMFNTFVYSKKGDRWDKQDSYYTEDVYIVQAVYEKNNWYKMGDTTYYFSEKHNYNYINMPANQMLYLPIKSTTEKRWGWIKIIYYKGIKMKIIESAIQK